MTNGRRLVHTDRFSCSRVQPLHDVPILLPTIVRIIEGRKRLSWQGKWLTVGPEAWLLLPAGQSLSFSNLPLAGRFVSQTLTFLSPPAGAAMPSTTLSPAHRFTAGEAYCFDLIAGMHGNGLCEAAQAALIEAFYAELAASGAFARLFPPSRRTLAQRLAVYFSADPGAEHRLETVAAHFAMSRATLARHLIAEGVHFRDMLAEARLNQALSLLQRNMSPEDVAVACGYHSARRFNQRFQQRFGLSPRRYLATCHEEIDR
ncbi:AraC family transcriptional regulator [Paludibacterium sp.]|uniref:AraC family transcriptional regulator n=1 Tax=Paludibacterium sp. TaxID=1917523 RepID=UPI0025E348DB|nr:AraC family transcriptional regulator [Paludibacterium sp.]MBV8649050.1 helix-turn-helix transcriptional regulator [Paludibacterium sp.]